MQSILLLVQMPVELNPLSYWPAYGLYYPGMPGPRGSSAVPSSASLPALPSPTAAGILLPRIRCPWQRFQWPLLCVSFRRRRFSVWTLPPARRYIFCAEWMPTSRTTNLDWWVASPYSPQSWQTQPKQVAGPCPLPSALPLWRLSSHGEARRKQLSIFQSSEMIRNKPEPLHQNKYKCFFRTFLSAPHQSPSFYQLSQFVGDEYCT